MDAGVAIPTEHQYRVWVQMTDDERATLHKRCLEHITQSRCPLEAAAEATRARDTFRLVATGEAILVVMVLVIAIVFRHARYISVYLPDTSAPLGVAVVFYALVPFAAAACYLDFLHVQRRENVEVARSGPDCNPWKGLEDDPRSRNRVAIARGLGKVLYYLGCGRLSDLALKLSRSSRI